MLSQSEFAAYVVGVRLSQFEAIHHHFTPSPAGTASAIPTLEDSPRIRRAIERLAHVLGELLEEFEVAAAERAVANNLLGCVSTQWAAWSKLDLSFYAELERPSGVMDVEGLGILAAIEEIDAFAVGVAAARDRAGSWYCLGRNLADLRLSSWCESDTLADAVSRVPDWFRDLKTTEGSAHCYPEIPLWPCRDARAVLQLTEELKIKVDQLIPAVGPGEMSALHTALPTDTNWFGPWLRVELGMLALRERILPLNIPTESNAHVAADKPRIKDGKHVSDAGAPTLESLDYLGLSVDENRYLIYRNGYGEHVNLERSELKWHLFLRFARSREVPVTAKTLKGKDDVWDKYGVAKNPSIGQIRDTVNELGEALWPLKIDARSVGRRGYRLESIQVEHAPRRRKPPRRKS